MSQLKIGSIKVLECTGQGSGSVNEYILAVQNWNRVKEKYVIYIHIYIYIYIYI